ncbi:MAG: DUF2155 domain-containing protein [Pseudomonadota bacterium]
MIRLVLLALVLAGAASAQESDPLSGDDGFSLTPELDLEGANEEGLFGEEEEVEQEQVALAEGAVLRALDKVAGSVIDLELNTGDRVDYGRLTVELTECRYPKDNPSGDAYSHLVIWPSGDPRPVFQGWMIASSPALNALDHPRYDIWVLRCKTS